MSNKTITEFTGDASPATTDELLKQTTGGGSGSTKKVAMSALPITLEQCVGNGASSSVAITTAGLTTSAPLVLSSTYATMTEVSAPGTPSAGTINFYAKTDGTLAYKADDGVEKVITAT